MTTDIRKSDRPHSAGKGERDGWPVRDSWIHRTGKWRRWQENTWRRLLLSGLAAVALFLLIPLGHLGVIYVRGSGADPRTTPGGAPTEPSPAREAPIAVSSPATRAASPLTKSPGEDELPSVGYEDVRQGFLAALGEDVWRDDESLWPILREVAWVCRHPLRTNQEGASTRPDPLVLVEGAHHLQRIARLGWAIDQTERDRLAEAGRSLLAEAVGWAKTGRLGEEIDSGMLSPAGAKPKGPVVEPILLPSISRGARGRRLLTEETNIRFINTGGRDIRGFSFAGDGLLLAANEDSAFLVKDLGGSWEALGNYECHLTPILSPNGDWWSWVDWDSTRKVFALHLARTGVDSGMTVGRGAPFIESYVFSPGGNLLAYSSGEKVTVLTTDLKGEVASWSIPQVRRVVFSPEGKRIACIKGAPLDQHGEASLVTLVGIDEPDVQVELPPTFVPLEGGIWSPDGDYLVGGWQTDDTPPCLGIYRTSSGKTIPLEWSGKDLASLCVSWIKDGRGVVVHSPHAQEGGTEEQMLSEIIGSPLSSEVIDVGSVVHPSVGPVHGTSSEPNREVYDTYSMTIGDLVVIRRELPRVEEEERGSNLWVFDAVENDAVPVTPVYSEVRQVGWLPRGEALLVLGRREADADELRTTLTLHTIHRERPAEETARVRLDEGRQALVADDPSEAAACLRDVVRLAPGTPAARDAHRLLGRLYERYALQETSAWWRAKLMAGALWEYGEVLAETPEAEEVREAFVRSADGELGALVELLRDGAQAGTASGDVTLSTLIEEMKKPDHGLAMIVETRE